MVDKYVLCKADYISVLDEQHFKKDILYKTTGSLIVSIKVYDESEQYAYWVSKNKFYTPEETMIVLRDKKIRDIRKRIKDGK